MKKFDFKTAMAQWITAAAIVVGTVGVSGTSVHACDVGAAACQGAGATAGAIAGGSTGLGTIVGAGVGAAIGEMAHQTFHDVGTHHQSAFPDNFDSLDALDNHLGGMGIRSFGGGAGGASERLFERDSIIE